MFVESGSDDELYTTAEMSVTESIHTPADNTDSEEQATEESYSGVTAALGKDQQLFDFVEVPQKRCHCTCKLGPGGTRCIDDFSMQEQYAIRFVSLC